VQGKDDDQDRHGEKLELQQLLREDTRKAQLHGRWDEERNPATGGLRFDAKKLHDKTVQ
jgi:hypothetical protein